MPNIKGKKGFQSTNTLEERFYSFVTKPTGTDCWIWSGTTSSKKKNLDYGLIWSNGRHRRATQVSWELKNNRPFPKGKLACHSCDVARCVNPDHIWPGTMRENMRDCMKKNRFKVNTKGRKKQKLSKCKNGHTYTKETKYVDPKGRFYCRICKGESHKNYQERIKKHGVGFKLRKELDIKEILSMVDSGMPSTEIARLKQVHVGRIYKIQREALAGGKDES